MRGPHSKLMSLLNWFNIILTWYYCYSGNDYSSDYDDDSLIDSDYDPRRDQSSDSEIEIDPELMATQVLRVAGKEDPQCKYGISNHPFITLITSLLTRVK